MLKYFLALIMMMVFAVPAVQADAWESEYVTVASYVAPDAAASTGFAAIVTVNMERALVYATVVGKKTTSEYPVYTIASVGPGSGGVSGGGAFGVIRS